LYDVFIFHLYKVVILMFLDAAAMIELGSPSTDGSVKDSGHEDIHADEQLSADGSASARDPWVEVGTAPTHEVTMCDVALVSRRTRAIDRDVVYGLLTECLQDVSFVPFALYLFCTCY
jgi:hypothetical protein